MLLRLTAPLGRCSLTSGGGGFLLRRHHSGNAAAVQRRKKSLLVDGNNMLYYFYNPLNAAAGDSETAPREAVDGLITLLRRLDKTHTPAHISVFFDSKSKATTRKLMDPAYKALRRPTPQSLVTQLASAAEILGEGGVNCISLPGFEADDLIASYTEAYVAAGYEVLVVSNDNDFLQLARGTSVLDAAPSAAASPEPTTKATTAPQAAGGSEDAEVKKDSSEAQRAPHVAEPTSVPQGFVELYQPSKRRYLRERHVQSRFGLPHARLVPAFLALVGTRWGKIRPVEHMTEELAVELLTRYGSLPGLLRNLNEVEQPALRKSLKHAISSVETSLRIAQLNAEVALPVPIAALASPALEKLAS
ncbi:hypothetical protein PybrP1_000175 [[Pythium] brassicae (nom. inval.)]|nr:hypothetical protein PybrP1_000175 [[Pythium] brassicae (nom. inval.)]